MMYGLYNNDYGWGYNMMGGVLGGLMMIVFWVLLIMFIVWGVKEISGKHRSDNSSALEILKERYAKGEIDKKEFEEKKKDLR